MCHDDSKNRRKQEEKLKKQGPRRIYEIIKGHPYREVDTEKDGEVLILEIISPCVVILL